MLLYGLYTHTRNFLLSLTATATATATAPQQAALPKSTMPSLKSLKKKDKADDAEDSNSNNSDDEEKRSTKSGGSDDNNNNNSKTKSETTSSPSRKSMFGKFGRKKSGDDKDDDNDDKQSEKSSDSGDKKKSSSSPFKKKFGGFGRKKKNEQEGDDNDESDDERKRGEDGDDDGDGSNDENKDTSNKKTKSKKSKKKSKKSGNNSDDDDDESNDPSTMIMESNMQHVDFIRKQPLSKLEKRLRERVRVVAENVPEVHFMGEVVGGTGFNKGVSVKWTVEFGKYWDLLSGEYNGQSQFGYSDFSEDLVSFNHPVDVHFAATSIQGWPRMKVQVWELDEFGRANLCGYGFCHLPTSVGCHEISIPCWRPTGSMPEEIQSFFLGTNPQLVNEDVLFSKAWENRCRLVTIPSGTVYVQMNVIHRFLADQNVDQR